MSAQPTPTVQHSRTLASLHRGRRTADGDGVQLTRVFGQDLQRRLDPFLMLDAFGSDEPQDYIGGFPEHPHRGFETVTLMETGRMRHRDSAGHEGLLTAGGVQWMTAGRGIVHSEMPEQEEGRLAGFQLWLNLPAALKMSPPAYRDYAAGEIPEFTTAEGAHVRVIAGSSHGVQGAVQRPVTEPLYLSITLPAGARFAQPIPASHHAFLYVASGELSVADSGTAPAGHLAVLTDAADADGVSLVARQDSHLLLLAGQPLGEPIVQYGPFVMNTQEEIVQAVQDYRAGRMGA